MDASDLPPICAVAVVVYAAVAVVVEAGAAVAVVVEAGAAVAGGGAVESTGCSAHARHLRCVHCTRRLI